MSYVDGFVIPIPKKNVEDYRKIARTAGRIWREYGALDYRECVGDDLEPPFGRPFGRLLRLKPGETAIFAWILYKSKAHRDRVNAKVLKDPRLKADEKGMPFDVKRMSYGGFKTIVEA